MRPLITVCSRPFAIGSSMRLTAPRQKLAVPSRWRLQRKMSLDLRKKLPAARVAMSMPVLKGSSSSSLKNDGATLFEGLIGKAKSAGDMFAAAAHEFAPHIKDLLYFDPNKRSRNYDRTELWLNDDIRASETFGSLRTLAKAMQTSAEKAITCNQELVGYLESIEGAASASAKSPL